MVKSKDIEVTVQVDGRNLQEYNDDVEIPQDNVVTRYVQAVSGAEFTINIQTPAGHQSIQGALRFDMYAEGVYIGATYRSFNQTAFESSIKNRESQGDAGWKAQPLVFAGIDPGKSSL